MRRLTYNLTLCSAVTTAVVMSTLMMAPTSVRAQTAKAPSTQTNKVAPTKTTKAAPARTVLVETGTIAKFDPATALLTISTSKGTEEFSMPAGARVQEGKRRIASASLGSMVGQEIRVRYMEANGHKTAESVSVLPAKKAAAKKS